MLALSTALVALLHLVGIGWHLPHHPQGDEKVLWLQVRLARGVEFSPEEVAFARSYPSLLGRAADLVVPERAPEPPHELDPLRAWSLHELRWIRELVAVLSAGLVPATWFLARRFVGDRWAFVAAALASSSTIAVWYSSMARPHAVLVVFTTATVAASLRARATGRVIDFALAGAFAAIGLGILQSGAVACVAVAAAWWWCARPRLGAPIVGAAVAAALVVVSYFAFLRGDPPTQTEAPRSNALFSFIGIGVHNVGLDFFDGRGFGRFASTMRDHEPVLAVLAAIGALAVVAAFRRGAIDRARRAVAWTAAAHPLAHFALFAMYSDAFQRLWLPLIPSMAILATIGLRSACAGGPARRPIAIACGALVAVQLAIAVKIAVLRARDDTHELAAAWIEAHPERAPYHVGPTIRLPLLARDETYRAELPPQRKHFVPWISANLDLAKAERARLALDLRDLPVRRTQDRELLERDVGAWMTAVGPGTYVLERFFDGRRPLFDGLHGELARRGDPLARFDPIPLHAPGSRPIDYMLDSGLAPETWFAWSVLCASRLGPEIEIYATER